MAAPAEIYTDYNQTVLDYFGYRIYDNGTISNGSACYLSFGSFVPAIEANGTVFNGTVCDYPYWGIKGRGAIGIVFASLSIILLPATFHMLRKHGSRHTPVEYKRFRLFGRRWQWYWLFVAHALAAVAGFMSIDIDRDYIEGSALTTYGAVYSSVGPVCLAAVWEMTRHWGSFEERRIFEADPFRFKAHDRRSKIHLLMPVIFYFWDFLYFLLTVLRNWSVLIKVNSSFIVDGRWKAGVFFGLIAFFFIIGQVGITFYYYRPHRLPPKIPLCFAGVAAIVSYSIAMSFKQSLSPFNPHANLPAIAIWGYVPVIYIFFVMNVCAHLERNEDLVIADEKAERDRLATDELMAKRTTDTSNGTKYAPSTLDQRTFTNDEIKAFIKSNAKTKEKPRHDSLV